MVESVYMYRCVAEQLLTLFPYILQASQSGGRML